MPKYRHSDIATLGHQLTLSPRRLRLAQIRGAERLLELIENDREYPYDFVCFHLTGYRPLKPCPRPLLKGEALIADLVRLIEHLSQSAALPRSALPGPVFTQDELSQRLSVSTKTVSRWRQRGLSGLRILDVDRVSRLVFTETAVRRFVARNRDLVLRGGSFKQLTEVERLRIITRATELVGARRLKLQEVARQVAAETGRAVETIRYTLRRHDEACPEQALFGPGGRPRVPEAYTSIYQAYRRGVSFESLASQFGEPVNTIRRICLEMRAYELKTRRFTYVFHPDFDAPDAEARILGVPEPVVAKPGEAVPAPPDAPAYLKALYGTPLLVREQEYDLFRRYNYCKYRAHVLIEALDPCKATRARLDEIDRHTATAGSYQNRILKANLRLVVHLANRHRRAGVSTFELISDGNMSLLRAVERFDFSRGYKFSTYASWAIMKNFARTIPEERQRYSRYVTGRDEILDASADARPAVLEQPADAASVKTALAHGLAQLDERERAIVAAHYGLGGVGQHTTLEQLGAHFGVTKERVRQIENRALAKLKKILSPSLADHFTGP